MKFAAIDIGSNAVRLQIARLNDNPLEPFKKVEFVRIPIRLGDDAFNRGKISKEKRQMFYKAMQSFKLMMEVFGVHNYMACATSAMREAKNGKKIVEKVAEDFDLTIDIISATEIYLLARIMNYPAYTYYYDFTVVLPIGVTYTYFEGTLTITQNISEGCQV